MTDRTEYPAARPYLCAYLVLRDGDKIAMVHRANTGWMDDHWGMVGGKVENNETFTAAAIREAQEEAGITIQPDDLQLKVIVQLHDTDSDWIDVVFETTKWDGEAHNAEPYLHSKLQWFNADEMPENMIPVARVFLDAIAEGKTYVEYGWN